jgi:hypothetical protein
MSFLFVKMVPRFSSEVFDMSLSCRFLWWLSQWVRGLIACLRSWICYSAQKRLSNTELTLLAISTLWPHALGNEAFIIISGYMGSSSLKISHPCGFSMWGKEYGPWKVNVRHYTLQRRLVYDSRYLQFLQVALNVKMTKFVRIPGMLQHLALGIWKTVCPRPQLFHDHVWPDPFWFQLSGSLSARALQED